MILSKKKKRISQKKKKEVNKKLIYYSLQNGERLLYTEKNFFIATKR